MDRLVTKTLAEIYLRQGYFQEAYQIFKALSEKDPSDTEIQERLRVLSQKLRIAPSSKQQTLRSHEEKMRFLKKWLANIQERRRG
jgi:hypothetical protein